MWGPRVRDTTAGHSTAADLVPRPTTVTPHADLSLLPLKPHEISEGEKASGSRSSERTQHRLSLSPHLFLPLSPLPFSPPGAREKLGFLVVSRTPRPRSGRSLLPCLASSPDGRLPLPLNLPLQQASSPLVGCPAAANGGREWGRDGGGAAGGRAPPRRVRSGLRVLVPCE